MSDHDHAWLRTPPTTVAEVEQRYDGWADTYDDTLSSWAYVAPVETVRLLVEAGASGPVLDVGCGTGLVGAALAAGGPTPVDGIDLSVPSLARAAERHVYRSLRRADLLDLPLPFDDAGFGAAVCVGVLTYVTDAEPLLRDIARVLRPGGTLVLTQRIDLWTEREFGALLQRLEASGVFASCRWTEPQPYMPGNDDYADRITIHYCLLTTSG